MMNGWATQDIFTCLSNIIEHRPSDRDPWY